MAQLNPPILDVTIPAQQMNGNQLMLDIPVIHNSSISHENVYWYVINIYTLEGQVCTRITLPHNPNESFTNVISGTSSIISNELTVGSYYKLKIAYSGEYDEQDIDDNDLIFSMDTVFKLSTDGSCTIKDFQGEEIVQRPEQNCYFFKINYTPQDPTELPYSLQYSICIADTKQVFKSDILPYNTQNCTYILPFLPLNVSAYSFEVVINTINQLNQQGNYTDNIACNLTKSVNNNKIRYFPKSDTASLVLSPKNTSLLWYRRLSSQDQFYSYMGLLTQTYEDYTASFGADDIFVEIATNDDDQKRGYFGSIYYQPSQFLDFDDMFLCDGNKQLRLRFDPKITSFKKTVLESKIDTIGGQYPIILRNGHTKYKEFSISATISYLADENELFMSNNELFGQSIKNIERASTNETDVYLSPSRSTNLTMQNIAAEFKFRNAVLEWLNDGRVKLFKSPTEGNMLIKLMNVSLIPVDTLGRMIYSFSATAYEIADINRKNLITYGFLKVDNDGETLL